MTQSLIPVELMEILNKINENVNTVKDSVNEVKERVTRIEAQDHADLYRTLRKEIELEREHRIRLQVELANVKTRLAPVITGVAVFFGAIIDYVITTFKH